MEGVGSEGGSVWRERRTEERKVGLAEPLVRKGGRERRFVFVFVHVQLGHRRDDAQVEAVRVGMLLAEPPAPSQAEREPYARQTIRNGNGLSHLYESATKSHP